MNRATFSRLVVILVLLLGLVAHQTVQAWGRQGHHIVAGLAQAQLTPEARKEIDRLLALEPGETLVSISTWADEHRTPATAAWHYVNFPRNSCTYDAERDCPDGKCVVAAIDKQLAILKFDVSDEKRLRALKYLVHLVADVHQPLHAGYLDDRGGNTYQLQAFMRGTNLHSLWDTGMIAQLGEDSDTVVKRLLTKLSTKEQGEKSITHAAEESCRIVGMSGYYPARRVGQEYIVRFMPVLEQRLELSGRRLASLLNTAFAP